MKGRIALIKEEGSRVSFSKVEGVNGSLMITVDLHGLRVKEAKRVLLALMGINHKESFEICAIHGYVHGTAIKEMIYRDLTCPRLIKKTGVKGNYGRTVLTVGRAA